MTTPDYVAFGVLIVSALWVGTRLFARAKGR